MCIRVEHIVILLQSYFGIVQKFAVEHDYFSDRYFLKTPNACLNNSVMVKKKMVRGFATADIHQAAWWQTGGRRAGSCWAFNEVKRLPGLVLPAVAPAKPRYLALVLCPAQAIIPPNPLSEHVNIKAKHLPSRSLQLFGNANVPPSGSLLYSLMLAKHQNVIKIDMVGHKKKSIMDIIMFKPAHSILQNLSFGNLTLTLTMSSILAFN